MFTFAMFAYMQCGILLLFDTYGQYSQQIQYFRFRLIAFVSLQSQRNFVGHLQGELCKGLLQAVTCKQVAICHLRVGRLQAATHVQEQLYFRCCALVFRAKIQNTLSTDRQISLILVQCRMLAVIRQKLTQFPRTR